MKWLAMACTAENDVLAWSDSLSSLESACEGEFRAICKMFGLEDLQAQQIKQNNLDFVVKYNGPRNTNLVPQRKSLELMALSQLLQSKVNLISELHQRIAHGFKRFSPLVEWQLAAYELKYQQANNVIAGIAHDVGLVEDYAAESNLPLTVAASLIINKYQNRQILIRKLERLRIRHQIAIRAARNKEDFAACRAAMDEDAFLSMMM